APQADRRSRTSGLNSFGPAENGMRAFCLAPFALVVACGQPGLTSYDLAQAPDLATQPGADLSSVEGADLAVAADLATGARTDLASTFQMDLFVAADLAAASDLAVAAPDLAVAAPDLAVAAPDLAVAARDLASGCGPCDSKLSDGCTNGACTCG